MISQIALQKPSQKNMGGQSLGAYYLSTVKVGPIPRRLKRSFKMDSVVLDPISAFTAHPKHMEVTGNL